MTIRGSGPSSVRDLQGVAYLSKKNPNDVKRFSVPEHVDSRLSGLIEEPGNNY